MNNVNLLKHTDDVNALLARYGVKFGIYKNNEFKEQLFPFDAIPRVIEHDEFEYLEKGLKQRVTALNLFLITAKRLKEAYEIILAGECNAVFPVVQFFSHRREGYQRLEAICNLQVRMII